MTLPSLTFTPVPAGTFLPPNDERRPSVLFDVDLGPVAYLDPSQGSRYQTWHAGYFGGAVQVRPYSSSTWRSIRTIANVTELSFTFDNQARPVIAYVQSGVAYLAWFNGAWVDVALGTAARGPMLAQDGSLVADVSAMGVVVAYLRNGQLYARESRFNYSVELALGTAPASSTRVARMGMSTADTLLIELDGASIATTAMLTDLLTDKLYVAVGAGVVPLTQDAPTAATWRSRKFVLDYQPSFAWCRLEGPLTSAVVRLYGDGVLFYTTPAITNNEPVRLPAVRCREFEIEIESATRITQVVLANNSEELRQV